MEKAAYTQSIFAVFKMHLYHDTFVVFICTLSLILALSGIFWLADDILHPYQAL